MFIGTALKNLDFRKLLISQITSVLSVCIINYLLVLKIYENTGSSYAVTLLWIAYSLPVLIVGPIASTVVDIVNRKKLLILTNLFQAFTILLYIPVSDKYMLMYTVVFIYSFLNQFYLPAESAFIPSLFKNEELPQANGVFYLSRQISTFTGYAIAGFLNKFLGFNINLLFCAALGFMAFFSVLTLPSIKPTKKLDIENQLSGFFKEFINGYRYISANKMILYPLIFIAGIEITSTIIMLNVPAMASQVFNLKIEDAALLMVTPALLGSVVGVWYIPKLLHKGTRKKILVRYSLITAGICFAVMTVLGYFHPVVRLLALPFIAFLLGLSFVGTAIPAQTFLQESTPKDMLGRIFGNIWFIVTLATIIPLTLSASVIELVGAKGLILILTFGTLTASFIMSNFFKRIEPIESLFTGE